MEHIRLFVDEVEGEPYDRNPEKNREGDEERDDDYPSDDFEHGRLVIGTC